MRPTPLFKDQAPKAEPSTQGRLPSVPFANDDIEEWSSFLIRVLQIKFQPSRGGAVHVTLPRLMYELPSSSFEPLLGQSGFAQMDADCG